MKKICSKCKEQKSIDMFHKHKRTKDGIRTRCKSCELECVREYQKNNRKKYLKSRRKSYLKHRDKNRKYAKQYSKKDEVRKKRLKKYKQDSEEISDLYIKEILTSHSKILCYKDIPQWLIEAKRQEIKLKRTIEKGDKDERQKESK